MLHANLSNPSQRRTQIMTKAMLALFALLLAALPQAASAQNQNFQADHEYTVKFLCGFSEGEESRLGVVEGHYNTIINVQALRDHTSFAYRVTALSSDLDNENGAPSIVSQRFDRDQDGAIGIVCRDIKNLLDAVQEGFVEGFVTIYTTRPLAVASVISGESEDDEEDEGVDVLQVLVAEIRNSSGTVRPTVFEN
jgi:hypothetical protein